MTNETPSAGNGPALPLRYMDRHDDTAMLLEDCLGLANALEEILCQRPDEGDTSRAVNTPVRLLESRLRDAITSHEAELEVIRGA